MKGVNDAGLAPGREEVKTWLSDYFERELGVDLGAFERGVTLDGIGVDSVVMAGLIGNLQRWLGRPLPPDFLWGCRTSDDVLAKLCPPAPLVLPGPAPEPPESGAEHDDFARYVNPHLGRKLEQLKLDKRFVRGEGCYLYDDEGRRYIDFLAQYGALPFGHNPPEIWDALHAVRERREPSFVQPSRLGAASELARRLIAVAPPGLAHVTFANSGAETIEVAIKLARLATGRRGVLSTAQGFHGKTMGALSASGKDSYQRPFGLPLPDFARVPYDNLEALAAELGRRPGHYAAFIVEPIQGEGGVVVPAPGYLREAHELCRRAGVLFVVDEVQTGLGRTGVMFASERAGVEPDILTVAKALGGGLMPVGACLCKASIYRNDFGLKQSSTFAGNALAARAGLATLDLLEHDGRALLRQVAQNGARFKERLEAVRRRFPEVLAEVRGEGYLLGLRLGVDRARWPENFLGVAAELNELAQLVASYLLNVEGVRVAPTLNNDDVLRVEPPLTATAAECDAVADAFERTFEALSRGDTALIYGSILARAPRAYAPTPARPVPPRLEPADSDACFGFVLHPLDALSYADFDPSLAKLAPAELDEFADSMDGLVEPFVSSEVRVTSPCGVSARGVFVMVSRTAETMMRGPRDETLRDLRAALALARDRGARVVGLGAYASIASSGGLDLVDLGVPLTSGNSYTVVAGVDGLGAALQRAGRGWSGVSAAVVGAAGAIGRAVACLLAERAERVFLIGNPARGEAASRRQLGEVAANVCRHLTRAAEAGAPCAPGSVAEALRGLPRLPPSDAPLDAFVEVAERLTRARGSLIAALSYDVLPLANVLVTATSSPRATVEATHLRRDAFVCDLSRPRSVSQALLRERGDVTVIDGGLVKLPGAPYVGAYGIGRGLAYACMAETMLLALDSRFENTGLGVHLDLDTIDRLRRLGAKHGFEPCELRSFGRTWYPPPPGP